MKRAEPLADDVNKLSLLPAPTAKATISDATMQKPHGPWLTLVLPFTHDIFSFLAYSRISHKKLLFSTGSFPSLNKYAMIFTFPL